MTNRADPPPRGACHLWFAFLPDDVGSWLPLLAAQDLAEVARQQHETSRRVAVVSRGLQRLIVGRYAGVDPSLVTIERSCGVCGRRDHGRPSPVAEFPLDYSVSHSGELVALAAVGPGRVGFDLEQRHDPAELDGLAEYVLDPAELAAYRHLPGPGRTDWLYRTWTRKEAVVKATGAGFSVDPAGVHAGLTAAAPGHRGSPPAGGPLHLRDLTCWPGYVAAAASTVPLRVIRTRRVDRQ